MIDDLPASQRAADLRGYLRILWRWKFLFLLFLVLIPVGVYLYEHHQAKVYESSTLLQVAGGEQSGASALLGQTASSGPDTTDLLAAARLIQTTPFAERAAGYLNPPPADPRSLLGDITATPDPQTGFITITADAPSPRRAAAIANAFAGAVVANQTSAAVAQLNLAIRELQRQLTSLGVNDPTRSQLADQIVRFRALRAAQHGNAEIVETATPNSTAVSPQILRSVIIGAIIALLLGLAAVALAETSDRKIRHPDQAGDVTGLPLLSAIPLAAFARGKVGSHQVQESFATLRAALTFFNVDSEVSTVLVTSPGKADGKTAVAVQLARALALSGKDVILLDADLRRPAAAQRLGLPPSDGLGAVLAGEIALDDALIEPEARNGGRGRLRVLPAGPPPPNPSELLGSQRMRELLSELTERSDIVVIDSTPLLTVSDSMPLLQQISWTVLIARINRTSREAMARLRFIVESAGGRALGVVATGSATGGLFVAPGYGYQRAYSQPPPEAVPQEPKRGFWRRGSKSAPTTNGDTGAAEQPTAGIRFVESETAVFEPGESAASDETES